MKGFTRSKYLSYGAILILLVLSSCPVTAWLSIWLFTSCPIPKKISDTCDFVALYFPSCRCLLPLFSLFSRLPSFLPLPCMGVFLFSGVPSALALFGDGERI